MKRALSIITLCILALGFTPRASLAGPDEYIGDAAIYTLAGSGSGVLPNILFIIDNSFASQNVSVGFKYEPTTLYRADDPTAYNPWDVHVGDNLGGFEKVHLPFADEAALRTGLSCITIVDGATTLIEDSLLLYGSYAGAGSASHPNISSTGSCGISPKGEVYVLGNYLNYLNTDPGVISGAGTCLSAQPDPAVAAVPIIVAGGDSSSKNRRYQLTADLAEATAADEPGVGTNFATYWTDIGGKNDYIANTIWTPGTQYLVSGACPTTTTAGVAGVTQREIIYNALENVLQGASGAAYYGAMVYGNNNHGAQIMTDSADSSKTTDIANLSNSVDLRNFLNLLPGSPSAKAAPVLSSNTGRPQAEALYDAGYYLNAIYPSITNTARIPSAFDTVECGTTHVILISNGLSNGDGNPKLESNIGNYDGDDWGDESVYGEGSHYLDDVASYLRSELNVKTHTVLAFQSHDPLIQNTAADGYGGYYNVYNPSQLQEALEKLINNILLEATSAFVAPVVPSNPENRTYSGSRIYLGLFKTVSGNDWIGNIKKYAIDSGGLVLDKNGDAATNAGGSFNPGTTSFWSSAIDADHVDQGGLGANLLARVPAGDTAAFADLSFRNIYSNLTPDGDLTLAANRFDRSIAPEKIGLASSETLDRDKLVNYIYGHDAYDNDGNDTTAEPRTRYSEDSAASDTGWLLGDILHAKPAIVNYNVYRIADTATDLAAGTYYQENACPSSWTATAGEFNKTVIYAATNDGMLHAFSDCDGEELWSFIPDNLLPHLNNLHDSVHTYFMDASPTVYRFDLNHDGNIDPATDRVILLIGQRRGGSRDTNVDDLVPTNLNTDATFGAYYALDVTVPTAPKYLWKIDRTESGFEEMGQAWSQPQIAKIRDGGDTKFVAIIGAGYDNLNEDGRFGDTQNFTNADVGASTSDSGAETSTGTTAAWSLANNPKGRGVYAFLVATPTYDADGVLNGVAIPDAPTKVWSFVHDQSGIASPYSSRLDFSIPSDVAVVDSDFDGYADRLYVGDTGGQVWRISAHQSGSPYAPYASSDISKWYGKRIFDANYHATASTTKGRKFFFRPSVVILPDHVGVVISSGDRAHPMNSAVPNRIFAIKDKNQLHNAHVALDDLVDTTLFGAPGNPAAPSGTCASDGTENSCLVERLYNSNNYGWYIDTVDSTEKFLASALVFNGTIYQTSYIPTTAGAGPCAPTQIGTSRLYALNYFNSGAAINFYADNDLSDGTTVLTSRDRYTDFGEGIPPEVTVSIPKDGDPRVILPKPDGITVKETSSNKVVFPLYWWQK